MGNKIEEQQVEKRSSYRILVGKREVKQFENLNVDERAVLTELKEMSLDGVEWIHLATLLDQWRVIMNRVIKRGGNMSFAKIDSLHEMNWLIIKSEEFHIAEGKSHLIYVAVLTSNLCTSTVF